MIHAFGQYELDLARAELRAGGVAVPLEPLPFALLYLLVENRHRIVSKDEIVEKIWDGRFITDAALATGISAIRRALRDDGRTQALVRTIRGRGFRFVGQVRLIAPATALTDDPPSAQSYNYCAPDPDIGKPVIAVVPFVRIGGAEDHAAISEAIPAELISSLSRLRWLNVIARASSFRFRSLEADLSQIRGALAARYCLTGVVEVDGPRITIEVDLNDTRDNRVIWSERFPCRTDEVHTVRAEVVAGVIRALDLHVPLNEAQAARVQSTEKLDAWAAYHLGLQHMYRFTRADNRIAAGLFQQAARLDPHFARVQAGLSFTSFQDAFLKYSDNPVESALDARRHAERSLELDPVDPMGNFMLGRALWLDGNPDAGLPWLERATDMNPNYAQGFYARAWADIIADRATEGRESVDKAMSLSPIDPLLYAMLATRSITHLLSGERTEAADWADRAARAPGSHFLVGAIAVAAHDLDGQGEGARRWAENVKRRRPDASVAHFFQAFPFRKTATRTLFRASLEKYGF
jgi:TolB-like protein/tetratricopeptide (TPR) repeat protein